MEDKINDKCGVFGIYIPSSDKLDVTRITYYALYGLQHRGQESAGIAVSNGKRFKIKRGMGLVRDVFKSEKDIKSLGSGIIAVGHNRYSTTGSSLICNAQPFLLKKDGREIVIAHNGNLINSLELKKMVKEIKLKSTTDTEIVAALLLESKKTTWVERFDSVLPMLQGAYSFVIATRDLLFGIRDKFGVRPLLIGKLNNGWVLSSEDCVFPGIGATLLREVKPGEAIIIDKNGPKTFYRQPKPKHPASCIFEYVYLSRPDSLFNGQSVGKVRERSGEILADESPVKADMIMAIPDSGTTAAIAFAKKSGIPFGEGVIQNRYIGRTFIQPDQRLRELGIRIKFGPMGVNLKGKTLVVVDDSIVRGTTFKDFVTLLRNYGAKKVHIRIACPPITDSCFYGVDTPLKKNLIAGKFQKKDNTADIEKITKFIGADSLSYLSIKGLLKAAGVKNTDLKKFDPQKTPFCIACMTGKYKIPLKHGINKFQLENMEMELKRLAVLISNKGTGTNLQAIIDGIESKKIKARIAVVVSDTKEALGLKRARKYNLKTAICSKKENLLSLLKKYNVDYICLAGWKQIITNEVMDAFPNRILNIHPGLVPEAINRVVKNPDGTIALWNKGKLTDTAINNFLKEKTTYAGSSIHFLTREFDFGKVLARDFEKIKPKDTVETLYARLKKKEHKMYIRVLKTLCN